MLSALVGNAAVKNRISALIKAGRLPHALLLEGRRGTGCFTLACAIARALVCTGENACGVCHNCKQAANLTHPDILVYAPDKTVFTVSKIRQITADAMVKPNQAARKVMILRACEQMNAEAQNAFLKTLEEPPRTVQFILLTQNSKMLLDTIRSRCTAFILVPPDPAEGLQYLCGRGYEKAKAQSALAQCEGNIGCALELLQGGADTANPNIQELLQFAAADKTAEILKRFTVWEKDKNKLPLYLEQLAQYAAQSIREHAWHGRAACGWSVAGLIELQAGIAQADAALRQNGNKALLLTILCEKMIRAARL